MKKNAFDLTTDVLISGLQHYRDDASDDRAPTLTVVLSQYCAGGE